MTKYQWWTLLIMISIQTGLLLAILSMSLVALIGVVHHGVR
jgi:hypothetical protein